MSENQPSFRASTTSGVRTSAEEIDPNQGCVHFRTFTDDNIADTGLEWMECACVKDGSMKSVFNTSVLLLCIAFIIKHF